MNESTVHAPYNFVPFSAKKPFIRYESVSELPRHDALRSDLKSGEIHITLCAETPVFVSDGARNDPHFFRGPDGRFMIPGSTVRGMLRENMQILGYGTVRPGEDLEDYQVFYREMASARDSTGAELKKVYQDTLGIETRKAANNKSYSIPTKVNSGHLFCDGGKYYIVPTREKYYRISRSDKLVQPFKTGDARVVDVVYTASGERITELLPSKDAKPGMTTGKLLFTGRPVGRQPNHLYLFSPPDPAAEREGISDEDILSYRMDLEARRNSLKAYYKDNMEFWALPEEGKSKPVFYTTVNGHSYFGMTLFLRIGYPHSLAEGLPDAYKDSAAQEDIPLDYPHAILGFAATRPGLPSYRSRVSIGDMPLVNEPKELPPINAILGGPKPSYYPGYVEGGSHYAADGFRLRGYKQYWLHEVTGSSVPEGKEIVGTTLRPLDRGSEFRGVIRFKNLTEDELGLLLWALRLEKDCYQTLGMGKPLGYGRMKLTIDTLRETDWEALYSGDLTAAPMADATENIENYIQAFDRFISEKLHIKKPSKDKPSITSQSEIQDLFYLKSAVRSGKETAYMALDDYKKARDPLPNVKSFREKAEPAPKAEPKTETEDDLLAALQRKFKKL